jgi:hypothetical protein
LVGTAPFAALFTSLFVDFTTGFVSLRVGVVRVMTRA